MSTVAERKVELRRRLLAARRSRPVAERTAAATTFAMKVPSLPAVTDAGTVAAYLSVGTEPGTRPLLAGLHAAGRRVLLPVLRPDGDLDWAMYAGPAAVRPDERGLLEPTGPRLGPLAVTTADVVLLPALAVDPAGNRLGRGAGCYDRVLARVPAGVPSLALLYDDEVLPAVPVDRHDRRVTGAVTETRLVRAHLEA